MARKQKVSVFTQNTGRKALNLIEDTRNEFRVASKEDNMFLEEGLFQKKVLSIIDEQHLMVGVPDSTMRSILYDGTM